MGQRPGTPVVIDDGEGGAADRVGAAKPFGKALAERGLARAKPAGECDERPIGQGSSHPLAQRDGLFAGVGDEFRHSNNAPYLEAPPAEGAKEMIPKK